MKQYLVALDNGSGFVAARKDFVTVEAGTAHDAALIFTAARPELPASFTLDVVLKSEYDAHGWAGCMCHCLDLVRRQECVIAVNSHSAHHWAEV